MHFLGFILFTQINLSLSYKTQYELVISSCSFAEKFCPLLLHVKGVFWGSICTQSTLRMLDVGLQDTESPSNCPRVYNYQDTVSSEWEML